MESTQAYNRQTSERRTFLIIVLVPSCDWQTKKVRRSAERAFPRPIHSFHKKPPASQGSIQPYKIVRTIDLFLILSLIFIGLQEMSQLKNGLLWWCGRCWKFLPFFWGVGGTMGEQWLLKQFSLNHPVEHIQKPKLPKLYVRVETSTSYFIIHNQFVK